VTTVLKLGGSVITEKDGVEAVDDDALDAAVAAVATCEDDIVLVHGAGSFGHHHAAERDVSSTDATRDAEDVTAIHESMGRLNRVVVDRLQDAGVPALPVRPLSVAAQDADGALSLPTESVETMLGEEFVPVLHGDVVTHVGRGATIASGDDIVVSLAESLSVDRVGLCSGVPGVLDDDGEVIERIDRFADVADAVGASDATDVTGGMAAKVQKLLGLGAPAFVFGPDALKSFLEGESPGTRIGHER
jgi:isopentenyl phosphate kinase